MTLSLARTASRTVQSIVVLFRTVSTRLPDAHEKAPDLPEHAARAIRKAMSKKPSERFRMAGELVNALEGRQFPSGDAAAPLHPPTDLTGFVATRVPRNPGADKDASRSRIYLNLSGLFTMSGTCWENKSLDS